MHKIKSLYIHYPHCRHLCNYCDFYKTKLDYQDAQRLSSAHESLEIKMNATWDKQEEMFRENLCELNELETVYIGGGTPSLWGESGAKYLEKSFQKNKIYLNSKTEFTMEVNPGTWSRQGLDAFRKLGVNRFSIGLQSLEDPFLKILDRVHSRKDSLETLEYFKTQKENYSVDFMIGLPFTKKLKRNIEKELLEVLEYNPTHLSLYILTVPTSYKHYNALSSQEEIEEEYLLASRLLREHGFNHYEVSNFAKQGLESKHNLKYWSLESVAAWGESATGYLSHKALRYKWNVNKENFYQELLSKTEQKTEETFLKFRLNHPFSLDSIEDHQLKLKEYIDSGLISYSDGLYHQTPKGYLLMDSMVLEVI